MRRARHLLLAILSTLIVGPLAARAGGLDLRGWLDRPGTRLVAVEFYATWCKPCMAAVPSWRALHEKYRAEGLRLIVVSTLDPEGQCVNPGWNPDEMVCDPEGEIAAAFKLDGKLPAAFLWSWQGNLLVNRGHVDQVEARVVDYLKGNPRVLVEASNAAGKPNKVLHELVRRRLAESGKLTVVATAEERRALARIRKTSYKVGFDDKMQCELGREVSANSLLKAAITGRPGRWRLSLTLFSAESACLLVAASAPWDPKRPGQAVAEAVDRLLGKIKQGVQMPFGRPGPPVSGPTGPKVLGEQPTDWTPETAEQVIVSFASRPPGAVVLVDADLACQQTPCSRGVPKGQHLVSMQAERHAKRQERLNLTEGSKVDWALTPNYGWLTVRSAPAGLDVQVNDQPAGKTPLVKQEKAPGKYRVLVKSPCHYDAGEEVRVDQGKEQTVDLALKEKQGAVKVTARDEKGNDLAAEVLVDGRKVGRTPGTYKVSVCAKELEVRSEKHGAAKKTLQIQERQVQPVSVVLAGGAGAAGLQWVHSAPAGIDFTKSEITVAQYQACVKARKCQAAHFDDGTCYVYSGGKWQPGKLPESFRGDTQPVVCVDWNQAKAVCEWAGGRLPTEQEWEAEASNKGRREYPWGGEKPSCDRAIWNQGGLGCGRNSTWPVCSKPAGNSVSGMCDMAGNVWEWTSSLYSNTGNARVLRGGSWPDDDPQPLRAAFRYRRNPTLRRFYVGVRCVRSSR